MKAYRIHAPHTITLDEMDAIPVGDNCVKLKNLMCGISNTDVSVFKGKLPAQYPIIPVRQCVGFVPEVGANVSGLSRGNRVVTYPQASCHSCSACKDGKFYYCEKAMGFGKTENGFMSDFSVVSANDVYAIPERLKDEDAIFTEHTAAAINVMNKLDIDKGDQIIIVGATVVGIILAQVAIYYQAVPIVVDMREDLLDAAFRAGVYYTINSVKDDVGKKITSITGGHMADACAYLLSSAMPLQNVFDYTCRRGKIALVGHSYDNEIKCNLASLVEKNLELISINECGKNYPSAINMLANHTVSVDMLYDKIVSFADVPQVMEELSSEDGFAAKVLVKM